MAYRAIKVMNNNVLLAQQEDGTEVLLLGKGIGFGVKKGQMVEISGDDQRVLTVFDDNIHPGKSKDLSFDIEVIERATHDIVKIAREQLGITDKNLFNALFDHISFAVERLKIGLPIDNPFTGEIAILCAKEYEVAEAAATMIKEKIDVDIGEAERGFIALHLYSARRNKPINTAMKDARVYKQAIEMINRRFSREISAQSTACKSFLMALNRMLSAVAHEKTLEMPLRQHVALNMREYHKMAKEIAEMIRQEVGITLGDDALAFLAVDICRLIQL